MTEVLIAIITLVVVIGLQMIKPEWAIGWLLSFLDKKLEAGKANKIQNSLGLFMYRVATHVFKNKPDTPTINTSLENIEAQIKILEEELKKTTLS